jgi:hypothetical protein
MFTIAYLCKFHTYLPTAKCVGVPLLSVFLGVIIGFFWELYQFATKQTVKIGFDDVLRTAIGFVIGGFLGTFLIY